MATSVILISLDSSEESMGTSTYRGILFGMIPTIIPSSVPAVDSPTIPPIAPTIQYTSSFVCTNLSDSDTSKRPPLQDPYERPPSHTHHHHHHLLVKFYMHRPDYPTDQLFLSYHGSRFLLVDLTVHNLTGYLRYSSSETSSDSHSDTSSDSSSRHSSSGHPISDSPYDSPTAFFAGPSHKRRWSPTTLVPVASPKPGALSLVCADLLPPYKRIRDSDSMTNFEVSSEEGFVPYVPREIGLGFDVERTDVRVKVGRAAEEEAESSARGTIEIGVDRVTHPVVLDDTVEPVREDFPELVSTDGSLEVM
ncbi:hypothetical protein Tco_1313260 [Tanacetum coccineum]